MNSILSAMLCTFGAVQSSADAGEDVQVDVPVVELVFEQDQQFLHGAGGSPRVLAVSTTTVSGTTYQSSTPFKSRPGQDGHGCFGDRVQ
jgi:hypothetical protein